ncbi:hypothetical protein [Dyadobacter sp. CY326]|uniref:hypothetical protein n=1 Tax=Dyadobacter sp. CY326 TaxID=2907300 RepID=UPI001F476771|nr:hypothetical protein [Dyadobacter sp. CY326]MCE7067082.1 hypothetical protein [Dyadobacter sp. CY326]
MRNILHINSTFDWTKDSLLFLKRNFLTILLLGLVAGLGRAAQLRAFGEIPAWLDVSLEVIIQSARLLTFVFALGLNNFKSGVKRISAALLQKSGGLSKRQIAWHKLKTHWKKLLWNMAALLAMSFLINLFIDHIAYETCMYVSLQKRGIINVNASEWTIILFLKNISVIPLTLVFNAMFVLWLTNKLPSHLSKAVD